MEFVPWSSFARIVACYSGDARISALPSSGQDWALMAVMGLGPLGAAFFLWDAALKKGDARQIGILSYLTPLASTALLVLAS